MTQIFQSVHPQSDLPDLWGRRYAASDLAELKAAVIAQYGPFPLLFSTPPTEKWDGQGAGIVITGIEHMPGAQERTEMPFLGGVAVGYVPSLGHPGLGLSRFGKLCTPAWDTHTKPIEPIDPHKGSVPATTTDGLPGAPPLKDLAQ